MDSQVTDLAAVRQTLGLEKFAPLGDSISRRDQQNPSRVGVDVIPAHPCIPQPFRPDILRITF